HVLVRHGYEIARMACEDEIRPDRSPLPGVGNQWNPVRLSKSDKEKLSKLIAHSKKRSVMRSFNPFQGRWRTVPHKLVLWMLLLSHFYVWTHMALFLVWPYYRPFAGTLSVDAEYFMSGTLSRQYVVTNRRLLDSFVTAIENTSPPRKGVVAMSDPVGSLLPSRL